MLMETFFDIVGLAAIVASGGLALENYFRDLERDRNFSKSSVIRASFLARDHRFICASLFLAVLKSG